MHHWSACSLFTCQISQPKPRPHTTSDESLHSHEELFATQGTPYPLGGGHALMSSDLQQSCGILNLSILTHADEPRNPGVSRRDFRWWIAYAPAARRIGSSRGRARYTMSTAKPAASSRSCPHPSTQSAQRPRAEVAAVQSATMSDATVCEYPRC